MLGRIRRLHLLREFKEEHKILSFRPNINIVVVQITTAKGPKMGYLRIL